MIHLLPWDDLPDALKNELVRPYYDRLVSNEWKLTIKRFSDILMSLSMLIILSPLLLLIALGIMLTSEGKAIFTQKRITTYGRVFTIYKFRTMHTLAEKTGPLVTAQNDPRVTMIGRPLRKLRLDELPQLYNILKGDMTFVGTRPETPGYVDSYTPEMWATLLLPAGVTSRASILFKDEARLLANADNADIVYVQQVLPQKMALNLVSLKLFSLRDEAKILLATVLAVAGISVESWIVPHSERGHSQ